MNQLGIKKELDKLNGLKNEFSEELNRILTFWSSACLDEANGGFIGKMDHYGKIDPEASKSCILNTRILWTFSAAYRTSNKEVYRSIADRAFDYLVNYFWDKDNGGLFWELDAQGGVLNSKKQAYAQGFGLYGFSEYFRATKKDESLKLALALFDILENNFWEPKFGGYIEALTADWKSLDDVRLSDKDLNTPKSMNTHLHILEPYSNLYRVHPDAKVKKAIESLLQVFTEKIYNPKTQHLRMFFNLDWTSQFEEVSFGHDIEAAWLLNEASILVHEGKVSEDLQKITAALVKATKKEGLDADGSLFNERHGAVLDKDKHWWPQAEALVGFMDAYELDQDPELVRHIEAIWQFIKSHLIDHKNGDWIWRVNAANIPVTSEDKVGFWKCPYHNSRALMELIERIDNLNNQV
ncbi:AGE family epimerase/isomerase [Lutimonas sp.]|uniref:AGE family epimerase/isomerase n=1 Tax=Lutimonas sp. TaxID=1872403 RepID=UPI003D9BCB48